MLYSLSYVGIGMLLSLNSMAQKSNYADVNAVVLGMKAGINSSNLKISQGGLSVSGSSVAGFSGGFYLQKKLAPNFFIQPELLFEQGGTKLSVQESTGTITETMALNYLNLPILAKYTFPNSGFSVLGGPQIGYLLSAKATVAVTGQPELTNSSDSSYKKVNLSFVIGAEYAITPQFNISLRYFGGLTTIAKSEQGYDNMGNPTTVNPDAKTSGIALTVGYNFK